MPSPICLVYQPGLVPYAEAWQLQNSLAQRIAAGEHPPALLLLEHPHTFTFGRRGQERHLLWDAAELKRREASVHWVDRGGDVTYHGPGQLVGYPLLPLSIEGLVPDQSEGSTRIPQADYVGYVRMLEETLILALERLGVAAQRLQGMTGVWVHGKWEERGGAAGDCFASLAMTEQHAKTAGRAKIAAIGVKVDARGITRHGFALNVNPDMSYWDGIIACGLAGAAVTSLAELLAEPPSLRHTTEVVAHAFGEVFKVQLAFAS
jgi:lipoyl(octanoyl) transferase